MSTDTKTDEQLMLAYAAGNIAAFEELFRRYGTKIYNLFLRSERHAEVAQDLWQECFLRVIEARSRYKPTKAFSSWLYTIAMNLLRDRHRKKRRRKMHWSLNSFEEEIASTPDSESNPEKTLEKTNLEESVKNALQALPADQREVILLSKYQGLSFQESAKILNISTAAAKQKAYRGMQNLRKKLAYLAEE
jgi:RNA polymerase sigma-70 factor (ECF subfamily)